MKRLLPLEVLTLFPLAALAQPAEKPQPGMMAWKLMYDAAAVREQNATAAALEWQQRANDLSKEVADLKAPQAPKKN